MILTPLEKRVANTIINTTINRYKLDIAVEDIPEWKKRIVLKRRKKFEG